MRNTSLMRVPNDFKKEVFRIAKKKDDTAVNLLKTSGVRLLQNADFLTDFLGGYNNKRKKRR